MAAFLETIRGWIFTDVYIRDSVNSLNNSSDKYSKAVGLYLQLGNILGKIEFKVDVGMTCEVRFGSKTFSYEEFVNFLLDKALKNERETQMGLAAVSLLLDLESGLEELEDDRYESSGFDKVSGSLETIESVLGDSLFLDKENPIVDTYALVLFRCIMDKEDSFPYKGVLPGLPRIKNHILSRELLLLGPL